MTVVISPTCKLTCNSTLTALTCQHFCLSAALTCQPLSLLRAYLSAFCALYDHAPRSRKLP
jgi:hypothetical protein